MDTETHIEDRKPLTPEEREAAVARAVEILRGIRCGTGGWVGGHRRPF